MELTKEELNSMMQEAADKAVNKALTHMIELMQGQQPPYLENCTGDTQNAPKEEFNPMAYKRTPVYIGNDGNGRKQYTYVDGNTQDERNDNVVKAYIRSGRIWEFLPVSFSNNACLESTAMPMQHGFSECAERWFSVFAKPTVEEATALSYRGQLDRVWIPAFKDKTVEDLTAADVQNALNDMGDVAKDTRKKALQVVKTVLTQAVEDGYVSKNVAESKSIKITGKAAEETQPYSIEQMRFLISHLSDVKNPTDRAWLALSALHQFRPEEVLGLKYNDIDKVSCKLRIIRAVTHPDRNQPVIKETKTPKSKRDIDFVPELLQFIPDGNPDDFIIGGEKPLSYSQVRKMRERIQKQTGFNEKIVPRRFRTTVTTDTYDATKDIALTAKAAGHSKKSTTLNHYTMGRLENANTAIPVAKRYGLIS